MIPRRSFFGLFAAAPVALLPVAAEALPPTSPDTIRRIARQQAALLMVESYLGGWTVNDLRREAELEPLP